MRASARFKACRVCRALVGKREEKCPVCGSTEFSDYWRGLIIILDVDSIVAKELDIKKEGYYAAKIL